MVEKIATRSFKRELREIGRRVRAIRKARGLTSYDLAQRLKISQAHVSRIETGLQGLRAVVLIRVASVLDIAPGTLFIEKSLARKLIGTPNAKEYPGIEHILLPEARNIRPAGRPRRAPLATVPAKAPV